MQTHPGFSIIMANYNNGEYIEEAINSVLQQTYKNWELLICDDASTDDSVSRISKYLNDPRVRLLQNDKNRGIIYSENRLIKNCRSEFIGILDSDDALDNNAIDTMYYSW